MLQLSNFSGCIIHLGSLYNGRKKYIYYMGGEQVCYYVLFQRRPSPPQKSPKYKESKQ